MNQFRSVIDKRQVDQILKLLNKKKQKGEIRTVDDFLGKLESLVRDLTSTTLVPTLKLFTAKKDELIDIDTYNFMLERIQDDLEAGFEETNNIEEVQQSHRAIFRDVVFKNLRASIDELESKVNLYEFLESDKHGFVASIFSTFREASENRTVRSLKQSDVLFIDPKRKDLIGPKEDADVDLIGERLGLPRSSSMYYQISSVSQCFLSDVPQSSLIVNPPNISLDNIIDNTADTYWVQSLLFEDIQPYAKVRLEFDLGNEREINFVEIEPVSNAGIVLESVDYIDRAGQFQNISSPETLLNNPRQVFFPKTATKKLILTFRDDVPEPIEFEYTNGEDSLFQQLYSQTNENRIDSNISNTFSVIDEILSSVKVKNIIGVLPNNSNIFSGYNFMFGLDNVRVGISKYSRRGIYVSPSLRLTEVGQLGLKVEESRPSAATVFNVPSLVTDTYDLSDNEFLFSSIEYWVIKRDYNKNGDIVQNVMFPILPIGVSRINHERLILTTKSTGGLTRNDTGTPMFFTNITLGDIKVYRNGSLLSYDIDWYNDTTTSDQTPNSGDPMKFYIRVAYPVDGDIFTVSYNPVTSSTQVVPNSFSSFDGAGIGVVDLRGDATIRILNDNTIVLDKGINEQNVVESDVFLSILIRGNSARENISAFVEEYTLLIGNVDSSRIEEL